MAGETVTYKATVGPAANSGTPTGTVTFADSANLISGCGAQALTSDGSKLVATCTVNYPTALASPDSVA